MTLPLLIVVALAVPTLLLILCYAFSKSVPWLGARPRLLAALEMIIGAASIAVTIAESRAEFTLSHAFSSILGVALFAVGLHRWFCGTRVAFE